MIKKIAFLVLLGMGALACDDDDTVFDVPVPEETISFEPTSGGAIMHYSLPDNQGVAAICVRYENGKGEKTMILGRPYTDTLVLTGFHAPQTDIPVSITVMDNNGVESLPIERSFNALASCPYAFMDSVEVVSSWGGVRIESSYSGSVSGIVDVYRVGTNPFSGLTDTLYITNFTITAGVQSTFLTVEAEEEETTIVLKSEDHKGFHVRSAVFPGLTQFSTEQYPQDKLKLSDPGGYSHEYEGPADYTHGYVTAMGIQYLTDGDKVGIRSIQGHQYANYAYTYVTNSDACGSYVQVELQEPRVIGSVRLYGIYRNIQWEIDYPAPWFDSNYPDRLPNHVKVFATNDPALAASPDKKDSGWESKWTLLADFFQNKDGNGEYWPDHPLINTKDPEVYEGLEPYYADVVCEVSDVEYKYIRVVAEDHFTTWTMMGDNTADYITYHELEVYVQKD